MEGLDSAAFDPGDIGSQGYGSVRWTGPPSQPPGAVVTDGGANRSEGEVWRQARQYRIHRLTDGHRPRRPGIPLSEHTASPIQLPTPPYPPPSLTPPPPP